MVDADPAQTGTQEAVERAAQPFFAPYRQNSLPDQVYEQVLLQIGSGQLAIGDRLPSEPKLAAALGVSRPVVRVALGRLRADGLIASRQGAGSFVLRRPSAPFLEAAPRGSIAELLRCFELRLAVEGEAAALAAARRTPADLAAIARAARRMEEAFAAGMIGADADVAFHHAVAEATGNEMFPRAMDMMRQPMRDGIATARRLAQQATEERRPFVLAEHKAILARIEGSDAEGARAAMRAHIERSRDGMLGLRN